jgi:hypothetical protein
MDRSRRRILAACSGGIAAALLHSATSAAQEPLPGTAPPPTTRRNGIPRDPASDDSNNPGQPSATKTVLEQRQKDIKKDVEKLFDLATQLKTEVEKTDATAVLSMAMVKKAEEIEKLAKQISNHARG